MGQNRKIRLFQIPKYVQAPESNKIGKAPRLLAVTHIVSSKLFSSSLILRDIPTYDIVINSIDLASTNRAGHIYCLFILFLFYPTLVSRSSGTAYSTHPPLLSSHESCEARLG